MAEPRTERYDRIGAGYLRQRQPDPRIAKAIHDSLGDLDSLVNVGAGAGSYEPQDRFVVAVEPSITMIRQRPPGSAPAIRARAEALPFPDGSFDAALAVLTIHHWADWRAGLLELRRVSRERLVIFTWDPLADTSWLNDYFGHLISEDRKRFPSLMDLRSVLGEVNINAVPIPEDCIDGFMGAYWRQLWQYLDSDVRAAISSFASVESQMALARLEADLKSGTWSRKYEGKLPHEELDLGYRLVTAINRPTNDCGRRASHAAES
jgi:SAM-dependent methyltransferase